MNHFSIFNFFPDQPLSTSAPSPAAAPKIPKNTTITTATDQSSKEDLKALLKSPNVVYINSKDILEGKKQLPPLTVLRLNVVMKKQIYFFNFTDLTGTESIEDVKKIVSEKYSVLYPGDYLIVTRHKGNVLFTQVDDKKGASNVNNPILAPSHMKFLMAQHFEPFMETKSGKGKLSFLLF